jgi:CRP/FNR family transcriptional regulator
MATRKSVRSVNCQGCAIRDTCALNRLGNEERARIEPQIRERIFHRGDVLLEESRIANAARFLKLGIVFAYRRGLDGRSRPIGVVSRGAALGIFGTFEMPSQVTCVALTTARVCEVPATELRTMSTCGSSLLVQVTRSVTEMFAALTAWSEAMRLPGVTNQLAYVLVLLGDATQAPVVQLPSQAALAELLGTRRESVARALRSLESEGSIRRQEHKRCELHRDQLLKRLSHGE